MSTVECITIVLAFVQAAFAVLSYAALKRTPR